MIVPIVRLSKAKHLRSEASLPPMGFSNGFSDSSPFGLRMTILMAASRESRFLNKILFPFFKKFSIFIKRNNRSLI